MVTKKTNKLKTKQQINKEVTVDQENILSQLRVDGYMADATSLKPQREIPELRLLPRLGLILAARGFSDGIKQGYNQGDWRLHIHEAKFLDSKLDHALNHLAQVQASLEELKGLDKYYLSGRIKYKKYIKYELSHALADLMIVAECL